MGSNESTLTRFELGAKKDMIESNLKTLDVLIKREYTHSPVDIQKIKEYKFAIERNRKQLHKLNSLLHNGKYEK